MTFARVLRVALVIGCVADIAVGIVAIFFQRYTGVLLDLPTKDPAITLLAGGELIVVGFVYVLLLRDVERFKPFLWIVCLDQLFAASLVAYAVASGVLPATVKLLGPIPGNVALAALFAVAARRRTT